jgi:uncharacterized protein
MTQFGLKENTIQQINKVFADYTEVEQVIIYGSRAKGNYKNGSDIDLTLKGWAVNSVVKMKIEHELDDLLLPYTFDLSRYNEISNPDLCDHIQRVGKVFYQKKISC